MTHSEGPEFVLSATPISEGIAIGELFVFTSQDDRSLPDFSIEKTEVEREITRYRSALSSSREDLVKLQKTLCLDGSEEAVTIIDSHMQMLDDPLMTVAVEEKIKDQLKNTESVFREVINDYEKEFAKISDQFFKQRLMDVKDLSQRILKHLHPFKEPDAKPMPASILFAKELIPSSVAEACISLVSAFISEIGGATSHAALIARSKGIPYVTNVDEDVLAMAAGGIVVVDAIEGRVILNPSLETQHLYKEKVESLEKKSLTYLDDLTVAAKPKDSDEIFIGANVESVNDLDHMYFQGADGVGLFRSEFLFIHHKLFNSSEQKQYDIYKEIAKKLGNKKSLVFRVFDIGSDKGFFNYEDFEEPNPALGCRGVRFLLQEKNLLVNQLKALLRISCDVDLKILIPLVTTVEEVLEFKEILEDVKTELSLSGVRYCSEISIGCMIEVPSAALCAGAIAKECDFLSIGTNDLVQYMLAVDRSNPSVDELFQPLHPCILKTLSMVVEAGKEANISVGVCGEMASDPLYTELLLGLGVDSLSCSPRYIPHLKKRIREISVSDARELAEKVLKMNSEKEIKECIEQRFQIESSCLV